MLPAAIEKAAQEAERIQEQIIKSQQNTEAEPVEEIVPEPTLDEPEVKIEIPDIEVTPEPEPIKEPEKVEKKDDGFKSKFEVLKGKYDAEVPHLHQEMKSLKRERDETRDRLTIALDRINTLESKLAERVEKPEPKIDLKEIESQYGEGFVDVVRKVSEQTSKASLSEKDKEIAELRSRVGQLSESQIQVVKDRFFRELSDAIPDWSEINENGEFLGWLGGVDPLSGAKRQDLLSAAASVCDSKRAINFFRQWKELSPPTQEPEPKESLAPKAQPSAKAVAKPASSKQTYSPAQIARFYEDVRRGKYQGKEAEMAKIEKDIATAYTEGRIV